MPLPARYDRKRFEERRAKIGAPWFETLGTSGFGRLADIPRGVGNRMSQPGMEFMKEKVRNDRRARMQARLEEVGGMAPGPESEGAPAGGAQALLDQIPEKGEGLDVSTSLLPPGGVLPEHAGLDFESFRSNPIGSGGASPAPAPRPAAPALDELPSAAPGLDIGPGSEARLAQDERDEELAKARRMKSLAEGLNLAGRGIAGLTGAKMPQLDDRDYAAEEEIAGMEDQLTASERQALEAMGIKMPPGIRRSTLSTILPAITGMRQQGLRQQAQAGAARTASEARAEKETTRVRELGETRTAATDKELRGRISTERDKHFVGKNSTVGKYDTAIQTSERALEILQEKGPQAFQGALTMVLKGGFGEAGNIGQKERQQLAAAVIGIPGVWQYLKRAFTGDYTDEQYEGLTELATILLDRHRRDKQTFVEDTVDSFMASQPELLKEFSREDIANRLGAGLERSAKALEEKVIFIVPGTGPESGPADVPLSDIEQFQIDYPNAKRQPRR